LIGNSTVLSVFGELDLATVYDFLTPAREALAERRTLAIDLTHCTFIDATAFSQIIELGEIPEARVATIVPHRTQVARVVLLGAAPELVIFATREEALSWLD
jgi:anti-anti-sigma regulatory factor